MKTRSSNPHTSRYCQVVVRLLLSVLLFFFGGGVLQALHTPDAVRTEPTEGKLRCPGPKSPAGQPSGQGERVQRSTSGSGNQRKIKQQWQAQFLDNSLEFGACDVRQLACNQHQLARSVRHLP